ncbi:hypothetical protein CEUSTIGMA_g10171.t1 [Chlamydomonas eustigma]|uniref:Metallo-beta-lactamase domain-containing protein n=1 Tax=Chlamydomonas eustigma TaxID=1157962 RepID=A0A250XI29_9CHLO|nr:hypothetical protein CEUSTIGMA_g10171.t1 [Chlamydomonas eustigma]|eukprot:GAX82745.1 hypothetical protein CEUSTIGMA_g10171.t1 [Chlamydomonas eustigma]
MGQSCIAESKMEALILGVAQDGGVPHLGCECHNCSDAVHTGLHKCAVSMSLINSANATPEAWLIDCGPDIKQQWRLLKQHCPKAGVQGVFLTHLHMGHYIGLYQFGKEAMQSRGLKIFCTPRTAEYLNLNQPWKYCIAQGYFQIMIVAPGVQVQLGHGLSVTPVEVPHRQEFSDTVAYSITGCSGKKLFWCPDIDSWEEWDLDVREVVESHDMSFLDATFYSPEELKRRDMGDIPHPLIPHTMHKLQGLGSKVRLIHMNHTNPVWDPRSIQSQELEKQGFQTGVQGSVFTL